VLEREGLNSRVCECYDVVRREFERLAPDDARSPASLNAE
jgi:hypothetical protein